jgi:hypothetical protein
MPLALPAPTLPHIDLDNIALVQATQQLQASTALAIVTRTFWWYETFRQQNHDQRWNLNDTLYYGWVPQKYWEGTKIPRSSLPYNITFDQIESALPAITQEIFAPGSEWFQVEAESGNDPKEARDVQANMTYYLEHAHDDYGLSARTELEQSFKAILLYGLGGVALEWDPIKSRPLIYNVDIRDFYVDPHTPTPSVDDSRSVIRRKSYTIDEIKDFRKNPQMSVPSDDILYGMAQNKPYSLGDQTKSNAEALRGINYTPGASDWSPMPSERHIEVLMYYTKTRIIWVLNKQWVLYNAANPYGCIPFCFAPCYTVPGRFYSMSIADVQEGNQRTIEFMLNGRIDEVTLALHPPRVMSANSMMTPSQSRWRPGAIFTSQSPKDDMQLLQPSSATTNIYTEIEFLERAAEKRTGVNALGMGGSSSPSGMRTAAGVNAQVSGGALRLRHIIGNIENYLIVPMLYKLYKILQTHTSPGQMLPGVDQQGGFQYTPASNYFKKMRFRMLASSRMMTRERLLQLVPFLTQYFLNGSFLTQLAQTGQTVDFAEFAQMLQDASGAGKLYTLIRPMKPEEQQARQQQQQQAQQAEQQKSQGDQQTKMQIAQMQSQTEIQKAQIAKQPDTGEMEKMQAELQIEQQIAQIKMQSDQQLAQIKIQAERDKREMEMRMKQMEMQFKMQETGLKLQSNQALHQQQLQQKQEADQAGIQSNFSNHMLGMNQSQQKHDQNMLMQKEKQALAATASRTPRKKAEVRKKAKSPSPT